MTSVIVDEQATQERLIPQNARYGSSIFANIITLFSIFFILIMAVLLLWGFLTTLLAIRDFSRHLDQGLSTKNPRYPAGDPEGTRIDYGFWVRWAIAGYVLALVLYYPTRWLTRNYGRQSLEISDEGVKITKFSLFRLLFFPIRIFRAPFDLARKKFGLFNLSTSIKISWEGILDITVKESASVFAFFAGKVNKITIYSMDFSLSIESMTLRNQQELSNKLKVFGDSLEERIIDFGYGAQIAVVWRRIKRSQVGVLGAFLVVFFLAFSIFGATLNLINPVTTLESQLQKRTVFGFWNPNFLNLDEMNREPSSRHWFGTDGHGRDIFARLLYGAFPSILIGVVATLITTVIGAFIGAASGYIGGTFDQIAQRITEVFVAMPGLPILLLVSASFYPLIDRLGNIQGAYYLIVFTIFAFISWGGTARIIRAEVLALKNSEFIQAEKVLGATHWRIITKHILPNAFSTIIIFFTLGVAGAITAVAAIAYLGFGSASTLVWGQDLADSVGNQPTKYWWGPTFISLALFLLVLGFNLLGDALRDALDPRLKE